MFIGFKEKKVFIYSVKYIDIVYECQFINLKKINKYLSNKNCFIKNASKNPPFKLSTRMGADITWRKEIC